jgi:zinc protease
VKKYTLSNGLRLTVVPDSSIALATVDMWVKVGSGDEPPELAGVSHFLEHMLFKGTPSLPVGEYDRLVEEAGGYLNAATSMDYTHYFVTLPSAALPGVLKHFADVIQNSSIDASEFENERKVVLEEINRKFDSPFGYLFDEAIPAMFAEGPYRHPVLGSRESVSALTPEQMREHYQRFYTPENMFLIVVGDVDPEAMRSQCEEVFGALTRKLTPWRDAAPATQYSTPAERVLPKDWNEAYFMVAFPGPAVVRTVREHAVIEYVSEVLAGGRTSRLVNSLQEKKGLVSSIGAYLMTNRSSAPLIIYGTCKPEQLEAAREAVQEELESLAREGPSRTEMSRVERQSVNGHLYSLETNAGRASTIGYSQVLVGTTAFFDGYTEELKKVSADDVQDFVKKYFVAAKASHFVTMKEPV